MPPPSLSRRSIVAGLGFGGSAAALAAARWTGGMQAQGVTPPAPEPSMEEFNALEVIYNHRVEPAALQEYVHSRHLPLAIQGPGTQQLVVHSSMVMSEGIRGTPTR